MTFGFTLLTLGFLLFESGKKGVTPFSLLTGGASGITGVGGVLGNLGGTTLAAFTGSGNESSGATAVESSGKLTFAGLMAGAAKATSMSGRYPYVWGGGHQTIGQASGPGTGYDCSGAVSAVLHAMGLLNRPMVSGELAGWGKPGPGKWVTVYANSTHTFMKIAGNWFGTGSDKEAIRGGPAWGNHDPDLSAYAARHPIEGNIQSERSAKRPSRR